MKPAALTLALALAFVASGCVMVPDEVETEFAPPDGVRPNHYHACRPCAAATKAKSGARPAACVAR